MNLEEKYKTFVSSLQRKYCLNDVDYFGINIDGNGSFRLKVYYTQEASYLIQDEFYNFLNSHNMIRYYESIVDDNDVTHFRIEYGLKSRYNQNIEELFDYIKRNSVIPEQQLKMAKYIAEMKTTNRDDCKFSSLYFIGLEKKDKFIQRAKFYYYCRFCKNPDVLSKDSEYRDDDYLHYARSLNIPQMKLISEQAEIILREEKTHMWMIGLDTAGDSNKYKLYLKISEKLFLFKPEIICPCLSRDLNKVVEWYKLHKEYFFSGAALCIDDKNKLSVNLYFLNR